MGQLLTEFIDMSALSVVTEQKEPGKEPTYKIKGIMLQADTKNKNGRIYPLELLEKEVLRYNDEKIKTRRAMGQLEHCQDPQIHLDRVSHIIEALDMKGKDGYGTAKLIDTPMGRIAMTLVKENILLGMSTRGIGTMNPDGTVNDDYQIAAIDLIADPSAPKAFVEGIMESKNWILGTDGLYIEAPMQAMKQKVDTNFSTASAAQAMQDFINEMNDSMHLRRML
jgi:hypothetical protein